MPQHTGQDKSSEQHFYDELFARRGRFDQFGQDVYRQMARLAQEGAPGKLALDIGCGAGDLSLCLIDEGFRVVSADLSIEALRIAIETVHGAGHDPSSINADAEHLPLPDASVDACLCSLLLHHFSTLLPIASEIRRVLKPGGIVVALDANGHNPFAFLYFNVIHRFWHLSGLTPNQRALQCGEIERAFREQGFHDFEFSSISTALKRDWLGGGIGATLNFHTRAAALRVSEALLPQIRRGNCLLSRFQRD